MEEIIDFFENIVEFKYPDATSNYTCSKITKYVELKEFSKEQFEEDLFKYHEYILENDLDYNILNPKSWDKVLNISNKNISGIDLSKYDLRGVHFYKCNMDGCIFDTDNVIEFVSINSCKLTNIGNGHVFKSCIFRNNITDNNFIKNVFIDCKRSDLRFNFLENIKYIKSSNMRLCVYMMFKIDVLQDEIEKIKQYGIETRKMLDLYPTNDKVNSMMEYERNIRSSNDEFLLEFIKYIYFTTY